VAKKWIQEAIGPKSKGKLHNKLGIAPSKKIPKAKINAAAKKGGTIGKEARLAKTLSGFRKK
jgi:hypothetical protein